MNGPLPHLPGPIRFASGLLVVVMACVLAALFPPGPSAAAVPAAQPSPPGLAGTWRVTRVCVAGCTGTTLLTESVAPYRNDVFLATGTVRQLLYPISARKVLVHGDASSSLLTIVSPGLLMRGVGLGGEGSTLRLTWQCLAGPAKQSAVGSRSRFRPLARGVC